MLNLKIQKRDPKSNLEELRKGDKIPAVFYGRGVESTPISLSASEFKSTWKKAGGSSLITLSGIGEDREVVIQDLDINPVSSQVRHIDFYVIERGKLMEATVSLEFIGLAPAVKELGGILVKVVRELDIEVLPKNLPSEIEVDLSSLVNLDSQILVKDLKLPEGVEVLADPEDVVAAISVASEDEEIVPADISTVEIEKKGKKEEEKEVPEQK
ncbi:50S ribosomal protein L25 [Candidatus Parcubacteria bacterium]|nr:50S ribosomal protein L25 [Candidatus Parcubacteria bacterium]